jgi:hypothetical protein
MPGSFRTAGVLGGPLLQPEPRRQGPLGSDHHRVLLAQLGNARPPSAPAPSTSKTDVLMLHSPELKDGAAAIAKLRFRLSDRNVIAIADFDQLASTIAAKSPIGLLVLDFHGGTGGEIKVGVLGDEVGSSRIRKLFTKTCSTNTCKADAIIGTRYCAKHQPSKSEPWFGPRVDQIVFESCVVGQAPDQLASFGKLFHADSVTGCTWFHVVAKQVVLLPRAATEAEIKEQLKPQQKYLMNGNPGPAEMAAKCKGGAYKQELWLEWWRGEFSGELPKSLGGSVNDRLCKARSELTKKTIASAEATAAAEELKNELLEPNPKEVIVTISY